MMYLDRLARVCPPRASATFGSGAVRVVACNVATTSVRLDNDILQNSAGNPGSFGRALVRFHAEGNDLYLNFDTVSTVVANSAAVAGNTRAMRIPAGQERDWELDPSVDIWCQATTINGGALLATLRYQVVSFPTQGLPGSG